MQILYLSVTQLQTLTSKLTTPKFVNNLSFAWYISVYSIILQPCVINVNSTQWNIYIFNQIVLLKG